MALLSTIFLFFLISGSAGNRRFKGVWAAPGGRETLPKGEGRNMDQELAHEVALQLVYGANFRCVLYHFSSLTRLKGSWGKLWPKTDPKQQQLKLK